MCFFVIFFSFIRDFSQGQYHRQLLTMIASPSQYPPVAEFYAGKSIFITGGTGFLGKILIEKILYSCPDVGHIYLLIREKKGVAPEERLRNILNCPVFDRLRTERPENLNKIIPVNGDISEMNLGICYNGLKILQEEVSIVFHLAATVKFNEPLSVAVRVNVEGTGEVLKLCQNMKHIEVFVYMSTLFSNTDHIRYSITEDLYPSPKHIDDVYEMIAQNDPNEIFTPELLEGRPNTYTFTKSLAENLVAERRGNVPTLMIRPSVVTAAYNEPTKGWIASWMGPTPLLTYLAKGWLRVLYGKSHYTFEIIPVDYVVNLTIVATARHKRSKDILIYHSCSTGDNPLTYRNAMMYYVKEAIKQRFNDLPWPRLYFTQSNILLFILEFFLHILPAYIADLFLFISGNSVRHVKLLDKLSICLQALKYFSSKSWSMKTTKTRKLIQTLSYSDQRKFPCDPVNINWEEYMSIYFNGVKKYLLKI